MVNLNQLFLPTEQLYTHVCGLSKRFMTFGPCLVLHTDLEQVPKCVKASQVGPHVV